MPKVTPSKLRALAKQFEKDGITTDGSILRCSLCNITISVDDKHLASRIEQHLRYVKHEKNQELQRPTRQQFFTDALQRASTSQGKFNDYAMDLTTAFLQAGIPLYKVNNPGLKGFLEKYTKMSTPDESTLRKNYVEPIYNTTMEKILSVIGKHPVCIILDETTDIQKRYVLNILIAPLNGEPLKPMLFKMYQLTKTNATTVSQAFNDACSKIWPGGIEYDKVWLLVSDQAPYMISAGAALKLMFTNLRHISCIAHAIHRVCEAIRAEYSLADRFVALMKNILVKCPANINCYKEITELPLPNHPVITRWGTWIQACVFYCENYENIKAFIVQINADGSQAAKSIKELIHNQNQGLENELLAVHSFKFLCDSITKLESRSLTTEAQCGILKAVESDLEGFAKDKLNACLKKNPDLKVFVNNSETLEFKWRTKYAPLVSVDVERSFSMYKDILTDKRTSFTFKNIEMINVVKYNTFLSE